MNSKRTVQSKNVTSETEQRNFWFNDRRCFDENIERCGNVTSANYVLYLLLLVANKLLLANTSQPSNYFLSINDTYLEVPEILLHVISLTILLHFSNTNFFQCSSSRDPLPLSVLQSQNVPKPLYYYPDQPRTNSTVVCLLTSFSLLTRQA